MKSLHMDACQQSCRLQLCLKQAGRQAYPCFGGGIYGGHDCSKRHRD